MSYKCRICGSNEVENPGDVCELCAIGQDPYAAAMGGTQTYRQDTAGTGHAGRRIPLGNSNIPDAASKGKSRKVLINGGGSVLNSTDPYGNSMVSQSDPEPEVQVYHAGQVPVQQQTQNAVDSSGTVKAARKGPLTTGITKNISVDTQKRSFLQKWFRSLFFGIPFTLDDDITMFQVFPDYTGTSLNAMGNACDQVIVYGKVTNGAIAENNDIEVYGHRDSNNNVIASQIKNKASGTTITPDRTISVLVVWIITAAIFIMIAAAAGGLGFTGIVWVVILALCLMNLPLVLKILAVVAGLLFSRRR